MGIEHQDLLMGYPFAGFFRFEELPKGIYDRYKMYYVNKYLINGHAFYFHNN